ERDAVGAQCGGGHSHSPPSSPRKRGPRSRSISVRLRRMGPGSRSLRSLGRDDGLAGARRALAAVAEIELHVLLTVIDGDFLALADAPVGDEQHAAAFELGFGVRLAAMVDIAGKVAARLPVDGPAGIDLEQVFVGATAVEFLRDL